MSEYHFRSERAKAWSTYADSDSVDIVREQLEWFCIRAGIPVNREIERPHAKKGVYVDYTKVPDGYVVLFELAKEYGMSQHYTTRASKELDSKQIMYRTLGWKRPRRVWVAKEDQAREFFSEIVRRREGLSDRVMADDVLPEPPPGSMPILDIAKILDLNHATLVRWVKTGYVEKAGVFLVKRKRRHNETHAWPADVVAEILKRKKSKFIQSRRLQWCGVERLKEKGYGQWLVAATAKLSVE